ncbi:T-complex protein 1 subunit epsilon [Zea mays]|uniref:T-complex protein 1 subunit epsilon n=1 Tax=Zea mays TaxID=4577 RepID=A0A1D6M0H6_MAIZE|nr:T-complex protein 1 subunit epsilon [Zea mays]AQK84805.1 T-complex protein 1 subunit epsilon [Zea mays]AQK84806.1 T-complex protein 1 subunit epsilon [Zea mays]
MSGYDDIPSLITNSIAAPPSLPPSIECIKTTSVPITTATKILTTLPLPASATTQAPSVPIHQIAFPHSPSPIPGPYCSTSMGPFLEAPSHTHGVTRFHKLSFPTFDGKDDPFGWLNRCDQFFRSQRTLEGDKVWPASYHMVGAAQTWYYMLELNLELPISWPHFKELCHNTSTLRYNTILWAHWHASIFAPPSRNTESVS